MIKLKRVYEMESNDGHGYSILVDRLWPRGIKKTDLKADEWLKELAPSTSLRKWFGHDEAKWEGFKVKYIKELELNNALILKVKELEEKYKELTLLYSAKDENHNQAVVLKEFLDRFKG